MKLTDISEIFIGLMLEGKVAVEYVLPNYLAPPYDLICTHLRDGRDINYVIDKVGLVPVLAAKQAAATVGDTIDIQALLSQLLTCVRREESITILENQVRRMRKGEDLDVAKITSLIDKSQNYSSQYVRLDEVSNDPTTWRPTFYPPIDEHCGDPEDPKMSGVPQSGLIVIGGPPGCLVGSTMLGCNRAGRGFQISMLALYRMTNGAKRGGRLWDMSIPIFLQSRYEDGTIRLNELDRIVPSGIKNVFKLTLENGYELVGTADHPVLTDRGWVGLGLLTPQDQVFVNVQLQTGLVNVASVVPVGMAETFDVYLKRDPHNFLANGIVVHNTGKSSLMAKIVANSAAHGKICLVYTLEMTTGQIARRILQVAMKPLTKEQKHNVIISDRIMKVDEVYSDAMRLCTTDNVYSIFIDFSDMLVEGAEDEQSMAIVYRRCAALAKENSTGAPVFLLAQLNRNYTGGVPKVNLLRYSGMAEAVASLIFLIYNPNQIYSTSVKDNSLPAIPGTGYIVVGKSRYGYREGGPGAIRVDFDGKLAWGNESLGWQGLMSV